MNITYSQVQALTEAMGGDKDAVFTLIEGDELFHSGEGLYAAIYDLEEEGMYFLGSNE